MFKPPAAAAVAAAAADDDDHDNDDDAATASLTRARVCDTIKTIDKLRNRIMLSDPKTELPTSPVSPPSAAYIARFARN